MFWNWEKRSALWTPRSRVDQYCCWWSFYTDLLEDKGSLMVDIAPTRKHPNFYNTRKTPQQKSWGSGLLTQTPPPSSTHFCQLVAFSSGSFWLRRTQAEKSSLWTAWCSKFEPPPWAFFTMRRKAPGRQGVFAPENAFVFAGQVGWFQQRHGTKRTEHGRPNCKKTQSSFFKLGSSPVYSLPFFCDALCQLCQEPSQRSPTPKHSNQRRSLLGGVKDVAFPSSAFLSPSVL